MQQFSAWGRAAGTGTSTSGAFLAPGLFAAAADFAAGLSGMCAQAGVGPMSHDDFFDGLEASISLK